RGVFGAGSGGVPDLHLHKQPHAEIDYAEDKRARKNAMMKANSTVLAPCRAAKTRRINRTIPRPCSMGLLHQFGHAMTRHARVGGAAQLTERCTVTAAHADGERDELVAHRAGGCRVAAFVGNRLARR